MPRTKRVTSRKRSQSIDNVKPNKGELDRATIHSYLKSLDVEVEERIAIIGNELLRSRVELANRLTELSMVFRKDNNKTIAELKSTKHIEIENSGNFTANTTRTLNKVRGLLRSSSAGRAGTKTTAKKNTRASRSLSRQTRNNFVTPNLKTVPQTFGSVTPKVKPNAPQVILRRPKQGEVAISMQGSPLMVSSVTSDYIPNINIPLLDGRMIAIQPERGLRFSELPEFDEVTRRNLEMLRDNLNKVCGRGAI